MEFEKNKDGERENRESYKAAKKNWKLAVTTVKMTTFERLYKELLDRARTIRGDTESFLVLMRLHEGSMLSAFLSSLVKDVLVRNIEGDIRWCILFADDIVLIDETQQGWR
ncbi:hypothetical protein H5410_030371 [Solanum commersonii]|uniref:Reverse transcriptase domain-containing protein n=1 Tax=Solanum commersonii TaxID=4109 RepID=A0A9J5YFG6_SOLCO|nr:hypothetical protein H5410_030371 [Solanum commersonii]